jgi:hypothetical protein
MVYKARIFNELSGLFKVVRLGRHNGYFQAEYEAIERCPSGWQIAAVWGCRR